MSSLPGPEKVLRELQIRRSEGEVRAQDDQTHPERYTRQEQIGDQRTVVKRYTASEIASVDTK